MLYPDFHKPIPPGFCRKGASSDQPVILSAPFGISIIVQKGGKMNNPSPKSPCTSGMINDPSGSDISETLRTLTQNDSL
jgi:hypothetical protein